jgi:aconitate hydratase
MGVLPLQFQEGVNAQTLQLDGSETFSLLGIDQSLKPRQTVNLEIKRKGGKEEIVPLILRIDTPIEVDYYKNGGILPFVLRDILRATS